MEGRDGKEVRGRKEGREVGKEGDRQEMEGGGGEKGERREGRRDGERSKKGRWQQGKELRVN